MSENSNDYLIEVKTQVRYLEGQSDPNQKHHVFAYTMTITNKGQMGCKLISRHWIITDANNATREVKGEGVIGEQPYLKPGEKFEYTSFAVIETPVGSMHGNYQMLADDGVNFSAIISPFRLAIPTVVN